MSYFNEAYYMESKVSQLIKDKFPSPDGGTWTVSKLYQVLESQGLTAQQHYELYGIGENLNPNPYFNQYEYLQAKADQVNSISVENPYGNRAWTVEDVLRAIEDNSMTAAEHYERYGAYETDAKGNFINPSNAFDANAYYSAKLHQTRESGATVNGKTGNAITLDDVVQALQENNLSPTAHYMEYGAGEANSSKTPMVQTVPMDSRVENDPAREDSGETVPGNYNQPTPPPATSTPGAVTKPADMGGLANNSISPSVTNPDGNLPVPGDTGYTSPPANIVDTNEKPVIPPSTSGTGNVTDNWIVANPDGSGTVVDSNGSTIGTLPPGSIDDNGDITGPVEPVEPVAATATAGTDSYSFHDGVADSFTTAFGKAGMPGKAEVQKIGLTTVTDGVEYSLTIGNTTVKASAADLDSLVDALNAALQADSVPATVGKVADGLTITYTGNGAQTTKATLTEGGAAVGTPDTEILGVSGVAEMQTIALKASDVTDGKYTIKLGAGGDLTVTLDEGETLADLAGKIEEIIRPEGINASVSADGDTGLQFLWDEAGAITDLFSVTPPNAVTIQAEESTPYVAEDKNYQVTLILTDADLPKGEYTLDLNGTAPGGETTLTLEAAGIDGLIDAINKASLSVTAAKAADGGITLTYADNTEPKAPEVSLVHKGLNIEATPNNGTSGTAGMVHVNIADGEVTAGTEYTLTFTPPNSDPVTLTLTAPDGTTTVGGLVDALKGLDGYDSTLFEFVADNGGIDITFKNAGLVTVDPTLKIGDDAAAAGSISTPGTNGTPEDQTLTVDFDTLKPNTTYKLVVKYNGVGADAEISITTGETVPNDAAELLALVKEPGLLNNAQYEITASGNDLTITYKGVGNVAGVASLTSPAGEPVNGTVTQEQAERAAEVQTFDYKVSNLAIDEYTFTYDGVGYKVTPELASLQGLNTAWGKLTDRPDGVTLTFGEGAGGNLTVAFDIADGNVPEMSMKAPGATPLTAVEAVEGADAVAEVQTIDLSGVTIAGGTYVLQNADGEKIEIILAANADAAAVVAALNAKAVTDMFNINKAEVDAGTTVKITFEEVAGDVPQLTLTEAPKDAIEATTTTPGAAEVPASNSTSTLATMDTIDGFCFGEDVIHVGAAITELAKGTLSGITAQDFAAKAGAGEGQVGANEAGLFSYNNDYYLLVNNGDAAFNADADIVIKLTGVDAADAAAATVADIFG